MQNETREQYRDYTTRIAELNGIHLTDNDQVKTFTIDPSIQQKLETATQESSEFLKMVNIVPVDEQMGEALALMVSGPIASRTDTTKGVKRGTVDPTDLRSNPYTCVKTNFDTRIPYARLDAWAKFKDFQTRIRDAIVTRQGLDRIMIGWNGISAEASTDTTKYPLLQDVNIGWLQKIRANAPKHWMSKGDLGDKIYIHSDGVPYVDETTEGANVDYLNLDALATDAIQMLDPWAREDPNLVVICGSDLMHDKYFPIINKAGDTATEIVARDQVLKSAKQLGGKPAISVPYFPAGAMLITTLSNLSIYWQNGTRRRAILDVPDEDCIKNLESWNEAYVVEDPGFVAFVENIHMGKKA